MQVYKIIKQRQEIIQNIIFLLEKNKIIKKTKKELFYSQSFLLKKHLFYKYINKIEKENLFDFAIYLRKIGINKYFSFLEEEIELIEKNEKDFSDLNITDIYKELEYYKLKRSDVENKIDRFNSLKKDYPTEISLLFFHIFKNKTICSQYDIINLKNSKFSFVFNRTDYKTKKYIEEYYDIYQNHELYTDGSNLYLEYSCFKEKDEDIKALNINKNRIETHISSLEIEADIYKEENFKNLQQDRGSSLSQIKKRVTEKFLSYSFENNLLDHYLVLLEEHFEDRDLYKKRISDEIKITLLEDIYKSFEENIKYLDEEILSINRQIKSVIFCEFENTDLPCFSNIGYYENSIYQLIERERSIIKYISNINIDSFDIEEIKTKIKEQINSDFIFSFDKNEKEKTSKEIENIKKFYK